MQAPIAFSCRVSYTRKKANEKRDHDTPEEEFRCMMNHWCCTEKHTTKWHFFLVNQTKDYADLISGEPAQFNWGRGPTKLSNHFRIYRDDPRIDVWYDEGLDRDTLYQLLVMDAMDPKRLQNVTYKDDGPKIEFDEKEKLSCPVCYEESEQLIFARCCQLPIFCQECGKNYNRCTICHKELITKMLLMKPAYDIIPWLKEEVITSKKIDQKDNFIDKNEDQIA